MRRSEIEPSSQPTGIGSRKVSRRSFLRGATVIGAVTAGVVADRIVPGFIKDIAGTKDPSVHQADSTKIAPPKEVSIGKEGIVTPEDRLKEAGLAHYTDFYHLLTFYRSKYGKDITQWEHGLFPATTMLTFAIDAAIEPKHPSEAETIKMWSEGWGTHRQEAVSDARKKIETIEYDGTPQFVSGIKEVLAEVADTTPALLIAYPDKIHQKDGGGGYTRSRIGLTFKSEDPKDSLRIGIHEGLHGLMNTKLPEVKKYLDPEAFAAFMTQYLLAVGQTMDGFLGKSTKTMIDAGEPRIGINPDNFEYDRDLANASKKRVKKYPGLFDVAELQKTENELIDANTPDGILDTESERYLKALVRRNLYAQSIGKKWVELRKELPEEPELRSEAEQFLRDTDINAEVEHTIAYFAHQLVLDFDKLDTEYPDLNNFMRSLFNEFVRASSPLNPPTFERYMEHIEDWRKNFTKLERSEKYIEYGVEQIQSNEDAAKGTVYKLYQLPQGNSGLYLYLEYIHDGKANYKVIKAPGTTRLDQIVLEDIQDDILDSENNMRTANIFRLAVQIGSEDITSDLEIQDASTGETIPQMFRPNDHRLEMETLMDPPSETVFDESQSVPVEYATFYGDMIAGERANIVITHLSEYSFFDAAPEQYFELPENVTAKINPKVLMFHSGGSANATNLFIGKDDAVGHYVAREFYKGHVNNSYVYSWQSFRQKSENLTDWEITDGSNPFRFVLSEEEAAVFHNEVLGKKIDPAQPINVTINIENSVASDGSDIGVFVLKLFPQSAQHENSGQYPDPRVVTLLHPTQVYLPAVTDN